MHGSNLLAVEEIIRDLLIFIAVMAAILAALVVVISRLSAENPLKRVLVALCYRIGATLVAGVVAIPTEPVPGLDAVYDIAVPVALVIYWLTFLRRLRGGWFGRRRA
jgi:hypothetical protein